MKNHGHQTEPHDTETKQVLNPPQTNIRTEERVTSG